MIRKYGDCFQLTSKKWRATTLASSVRKRFEIEYFRKRVYRLRGRVLEVGCVGHCRLAYQGDVHLIGINNQLGAMIGWGQTGAGTMANDVVLADAANLPFKDSLFDAVVIRFTLCSVKNARAAASEIHRVMKLNAVLIFLEHVPPDYFLSKWVLKFVTDLLAFVFGRKCRLDRNPIASLLASGFKIQQIEFCGHGIRWLSAVATRSAANQVVVSANEIKEPVQAELVTNT
jgi:SAM-dependent methyltransferase